jgi:hypothetical protein
VIEAMDRGGLTSQRRGVAASLLFPAFPARFSIAILLTFFPYGILYPLDYPAGELLILGCWLWVFPSRLGWMSLLLVPLIPGETYGYYAFNLFSLLANVSIAFAAMRSREMMLASFAGLHRFVRAGMFVALLIAAVQAVTDPYLWMAVFPNMRLESGRGAGLRLEPSQFSCLLVLYLAVLAGRMEHLRTLPSASGAQRKLLREAIVAILLTVGLTRSLSVLIVVLSFVPALFIKRRHLFSLAAILGAGAGVGALAMGDRINDALAISGGSLGDLITAGVDSWRNVPDILIFSYYRDFILPGNPAEVRIKIHTLAVMTSPVMAWIQNTFSTFSAAGVTVGLVGTVAIAVVLLARGLRGLSTASMRLSWLLLFVAAWFFMAKWDPSAWVALGLLPLAQTLARGRMHPGAAGLKREARHARNKHECSHQCSHGANQ